MKPVFADTFYYIALLNRNDQAHSLAVDFTRDFDGTMVTTAWVLTELADGLADPSRRQIFVHFAQALRDDPQVTVIPSGHALYQAGMDLYADRPDKGWSLTDCISFVVMEREGILEALTGDHHFEQAGFIALLK